MNDHLSGRPVCRKRVVPLPITREPHREPLTPGLRREPLAEAIGFHAGRLVSDEDDE